MLYKAAQIASHSITLKILSWIFLTKLTSPFLFPFPPKRPRAVFPATCCPLFILLKDPARENSRMEVLRTWPRTLYQAVPLFLGDGRRVQDGEELNLVLMALNNSTAWLSSSSHAFLWDQVCMGVFFSVQCKIWWKWAFFRVMQTPLQLTYHVSLPSALMQISSSITCDSYKWNLQLFCQLADFCSHRSSAQLSFEASCLKSLFGYSFKFWTHSLVQAFIFFW